MDFDLGKLTLVGWLVFLATAGIVITGIVMFAMSTNTEPAVGEVVSSRGGRKLVAGIFLGIGAAFFVACRFGLGKIGLPMFRS